MGLLLATAISVGGLQDEIRDAHPLVGRQFRVELQRVPMLPTQPVAAGKVQPRRVQIDSS